MLIKSCTDSLLWSEEMKSFEESTKNRWSNRSQESCWSLWVIVYGISPIHWASSVLVSQLIVAVVYVGTTRTKGSLSAERLSRVVLRFLIVLSKAPTNRIHTRYVRTKKVHSR